MYVCIYSAVQIAVIYAYADGGEGKGAEYYYFELSSNSIKKALCSLSNSMLCNIVHVVPDVWPYVYNNWYVTPRRKKKTARRKKKKKKNNPPETACEQPGGTH